MKEKERKRKNEKNSKKEKEKMREKERKKQKKEKNKGEHKQKQDRYGPVLKIAVRRKLLTHYYKVRCLDAIIIYNNLNKNNN